MADPDRAARLMLTVFAVYDSQPNDALPGRTFIEPFLRVNLDGSDIDAGVKRGVEVGWFEHASMGAVRLTQLGFSEMKPPADSAQARRRR